MNRDEVTQIVFDAFRVLREVWRDLRALTSGYTLRWSWPGVQSASLYDNFRKRGNYVIMTSLMTS